MEIMLLIVLGFILFILIIYIFCIIPLDNLPIKGGKIPDRINPLDYNSNYYLNIDNDNEIGN